MFTAKRRRIAGSLLLSVGMVAATVAPISAQPDTPGRSDLDADRSAGSRFRPGSEITVSSDAVDGPREPGQAPGVSVVAGDGDRSVFADADVDLVPAVPVADGYGDLVDTVLRDAEASTPEVRSEDKPADEAGFVAGVSVYRGAEADGLRHIWDNPDGTTTVMYSTVEAVADEKTGGTGGSSW